MATIPEAFAIAVEHFRGGRLADAEMICGRILGVAPEHPDVLQLLGIISAQSAKPQAAVDYFRRAVAVHPEWADAHGNLGNALREQGRFEEAAVSLRRCFWSFSPISSRRQ